MPNVASVLKQEISRIAWKEVHGIMKGVAPSFTALKKSNSSYKKRIAQLEAKVAKLERQLGAKEAIKLPKPEQLEHSRLGASNVVKLRKKLGLTRAEMAKLIGASTNSIFLWENGKANPRAAAKAKIIALRSLGRRELKKLLAELDKKPIGEVKTEEKLVVKPQPSQRKKSGKAPKAAKSPKKEKKAKAVRKARTVKPATPAAEAPAAIVNDTALKAEESK